MTHGPVFALSLAASTQQYGSEKRQKYTTESLYI